MRDSLRPALVIAQREIRDQFRDWRIVLPIVALVVFFPFLMNFTASQMMNFVNRYGATLMGERLVPFLLMIVGFFPISISLIIALETFVGERERGSIEPLLNTPLKDWQIYLGKLLAATVLPVFGSYLGMAAYISGLLFTQVPMPPPGVIALIFLLSLVQAVTMVSGAVVVSSQATSVRSANLLASFIVIPAALLIQLESVVMFWGNGYRVLLWIIFGLVLLSLLFTRVGLAHFRREELLGREIDALNVGWGLSTFRQGFTGGAKGLKDWYGRVIPATIYEMRWSILIVSFIALFGLTIGARQAERFTLPMDSAILTRNLQSIETFMPLFSTSPVLMIWWQNLRAQLVGFVLGIFSFGILGMLPVLFTMSLVGYLLGVLTLNGISPIAVFVSLILPHGIFELPVLILANAAVLQFGAILATPRTGVTFGEAWISGLARWARLVVGLVIPLFLLAAAVEAWVTPRVALWILR